ncbi:hypothetical protein LMG26846_02072 [Achromobacter insuavis]|uniref:hypothetical protein n=1 Tax=Achromobacter insuavis TaxID=1287735 RepID=UPI00146908F7|nr:hypothetical protein [Achromobacter insuavis]CAB3852595.1 hypothetical protein LMG26846_02072 [Achromobacter insuavis]
MLEWVPVFQEEMRGAAEGVWRWLAANKDVAAVLVAIAVPVFQRSGEIKDRRVREAESRVSQYQSVFFLLCDVENDLRKPERLKELPGRLVFDATEGEDLLQRIRVLEQRELDAPAVIALFRARSLIMTARNSLRVVDTHKPLPETLNGRTAGNADRAKLYKEDTYRRLRAGILRARAARQSWWLNPVGKLALLFLARRMHNGASVEEPSYEGAEGQVVPAKQVRS